MLDGRYQRGRGCDRGSDGEGVCIRHGEESDVRGAPGARRNRRHLGARHASVPSQSAGRRSELRQRPGASRYSGKIAVGAITTKTNAERAATLSAALLFEVAWPGRLNRESPYPYI